MISRIYILLCLLILTGCTRHKPDERLVHIAAMVSESPTEALSDLDSINRNSLSEADRHYHDFLTIKANDKAYNRHISDSLILDVIDYYESNKSSALYPEALYYAGRVYTDLGDSPTALHYFQDALDNLGDGSEDTALKTSVLSQTGRLLLQLRLYDEATAYIKESIRMDELQGDTVNLVYDLQLLGGAHLIAEDYTLAAHYFNQALEAGKNLPESFTAKSKMNLAKVKYETGQLDSALMLIRGTLETISPMARNNALAYSSEIYLAKGMTDTAYIYAQELRHSKDPTNKGAAYEILLSPELKGIVSSDSIYRYLGELIDILEDNYDDNDVELSMIQQGYYNYSRHLIQRQTAENKNLLLKLWVLALSSVCMLLIIVVLYYKNKSQKSLIELRNALDGISKLKEHINQDIKSQSATGPQYPSADMTHSADDLVDKGNEIRPYTPAGSIKELREKLRDELLSLYNQNQSADLNDAIARSEAYSRLSQLISQNRSVSPDDPLFEDIEKVVLESSPRFKENLELLTQSRLTSIDLQTAMLIKCHVTPSQMCTLLCRSKGAIVSRRDNLCMKIFDKRLGTKVIDGIIRML